MTNQESELKVQALLEKIGNMSAEYENKIADLRVALTIIEETNKSLVNELSELRQNEDSSDDKVVEGTVV